MKISVIVAALVAFILGDQVGTYSLRVPFLATSLAVAVLALVAIGITELVLLVIRRHA